MQQDEQKQYQELRQNYFKFAGEINTQLCYYDESDPRLLLPQKINYNCSKLDLLSGQQESVMQPQSSKIPRHQTSTNLVPQRLKRSLTSSEITRDMEEFMKNRPISPGRVRSPPRRARPQPQGPRLMDKWPVD